MAKFNLGLKAVSERYISCSNNKNSSIFVSRGSFGFCGIFSQIPPSPIRRRLQQEPVGTENFFEKKSCFQTERWLVLEFMNQSTCKAKNEPK